MTGDTMLFVKHSFLGGFYVGNPKRVEFWRGLGRWSSFVQVFETSIPVKRKGGI